MTSFSRLPADTGATTFGSGSTPLLDADLPHGERKIEISLRDFSKHIDGLEQQIGELTTTFGLGRDPASMSDQEREALCEVARIACIVGEALYTALFNERAYSHFYKVLQIDERLLSAGYEVKTYGFDLINVGRSLFAMSRYDESEHCIQAGIRSHKQAFPGKKEDTVEILRSLLIAVTNCAEQHEEGERIRLLQIPKNLLVEFPVEMEGLKEEFPNLLSR